jgi:DENN (AEX-3) domain
VPLPPPGKIQVKFGFTVQDRWIIERPPENQLPLANFSFQPLFTCLSVSNILVVIGCLLQETRLVLVSKHYAILGPVAEALLSLLFPFRWQGMYLPILPYSMLEILDAPVPYLVGLHARYLAEIPIEQRPPGVVVVDLDRDAVHLGVTECRSEHSRQIPSLPERHALKCKAKLMEFGSMVYIPPPSMRVGTITTGAGVEIPMVERDSFAQEATGDVSITQRRRRDVLAPTDRAFRDNELLVPISGFISEQGQLVSQKRELSASAVDTPDQGKKKFSMPRFLKSSPSTVGENGHVVSTDSSMENDSILDMTEVCDFAPTECVCCCPSNIHSI